ncbi:tRNA lysidine(34) synthetase TilS [Dermacoccaceae bacterium W4C1]
MSGPDPATAAIRRVVRETLLAQVPAGRVVLAAVSGGPDSLALAAALAFEAPRSDRRAGAVLIDHGLQPGSGDVIRRAAQQCRDLGLDPVLVRSVQVVLDGQGPEAAARQARHRALEQARTDTGAVAVMLGHTRDDQAEQVLLGLLRGSGPRSLAGMASRHGQLIRPLLTISRAETEQACRAAGLAPWRDPHNADPRFTRARTRALLARVSADLGADVSVNLARTAQLCRSDNEALDEIARSVAEAAIDVESNESNESNESGGGGGGDEGDEGIADHTADIADPAAGAPSTSAVTVSVSALAAQPEAIRTRVLRLAALRAGADAGALASVHLHEVDSLLRDWRGQGPIDLPGGLRASRSGDFVCVRPRRQVE